MLPVYTLFDKDYVITHVVPDEVKNASLNVQDKNGQIQYSLIPVFKLSNFKLLVQNEELNHCLLGKAIGNMLSNFFKN